MTRDEYRDELIYIGLTSLPPHLDLQTKTSYFEVAADVIKNPSLKEQVLKTAKSLRDADRSQLELLSFYRKKPKKNPHLRA